AGETDGAGGVVHAAEGYTEKRDAKPVMKRADELPGFDANAVEARLALAASDLPVHSDHPLQPEALGVGGNQKGADAAPSGGGARRVGDGERDDPVGEGDVRRPDLAAGDAPSVAVPVRSRLDHGHIRTRPGFREPEAHRLTSGQEPRENPLASARGHLLEERT